MNMNNKSVSKNDYILNFNCVRSLELVGKFVGGCVVVIWEFSVLLWSKPFTRKLPENYPVQLI